MAATRPASGWRPASIVVSVAALESCSTRLHVLFSRHGTEEIQRVSVARPDGHVQQIANAGHNRTSQRRLGFGYAMSRETVPVATVSIHLQDRGPRAGDEHVPKVALAQPGQSCRSHPTKAIQCRAATGRKTDDTDYHDGRSFTSSDRRAEQAGFFMPHVGPRGAAFALAWSFRGCARVRPPVDADSGIRQSVGEILDARQSPSAWAAFTHALGSEAYLRPLRIAQIKLLFDLRATATIGWSIAAFTRFLLVAAILLFTRALHVRTAADVGVAAFALVVLIGLNTFRGTVQEAFPINHFLEIALLCLVVLNLAQSRGGAWADIGAALTFAVAALTLESGLLVWLVAVAAWAVGWRGISMRGLVLMTAILIGYGYLRFVYLATGVPSLTERSSGYLFRMLEPQEIERRFGAQPLWFYAYNVLASMGSVLFSEPRSGVFAATSAGLNRQAAAA